MFWKLYVDGSKIMLYLVTRIQLWNKYSHGLKQTDTSINQIDKLLKQINTNTKTNGYNHNTNRYTRII